MPTAAARRRPAPGSLADPVRVAGVGEAKLNPQYRVDAVILSIAILECLAWSNQAKGVTQIAKEVGSTKNRVFRHLETLRSLGYVSHTEAGNQYQVGVRLSLLGQVVGQQFALTSAIQPVLRALRDATGETAVFTTIVREALSVVLMEVGAHTIEVGLKLGASYELHATAQGKLALAYGSQTLAEKVLKGTLKRYTPGTITERGKLRAELEQIRRRGWADAPSEIQSGVNALAAPIFARDDEFVGTLAIVGFIDKVPHPPRRRQLEAVIEAGRAASRNLGSRLTGEV